MLPASGCAGANAFWVFVATRGVTSHQGGTLPTYMPVGEVGVGLLRAAC